MVGLFVAFGSRFWVAVTGPDPQSGPPSISLALSGGQQRRGRHQLDVAEQVLHDHRHALHPGDGEVTVVTVRGPIAGVAHGEPGLIGCHPGT